MSPSNENDFAPPNPEVPGDQYRNLRAVGENGSGRYFVGEEAASGQRISMVVARPVPVLTAISSRAHAESRMRLAREAAELQIAGTAPVLALGHTAGGHPFEVSELGQGRLLSELTADTDEVEPDWAIGLAARVADVLASAHSAGVVHGSVSPHTIIVGADDVASGALHGFGVSSPWVPVDDPSGDAARPPADDTWAETLPTQADDWLEVTAEDDVRALARVLRELLRGARDTEGRASAFIIGPMLAALLARAEAADGGMTAAEFADGLRQAAPLSATAVTPDPEWVGAVDAPRGRRGGRRIAGVLVAVAALLAVLLAIGRADRIDEPTLADELAQAEAPLPGELPDSEREGIVTRESAGGAVPSSGGPESSSARAEAARERTVPSGARTQPSADSERTAIRRSGASEPSRVRPDSDVSVPRPAPAQSGSSASAVADRGRLATVPSGTSLTLASGERVCTNTHFPGDSFSATVSQAEAGSGGALIPAGSRAVLQVSSVSRGKGANDLASLGLAVQHLVIGGHSYPVDATITNASVEQVRAGSAGSDAQKVIGGAIAGAILGQVLGKDTKSTVIGAATGAAAGTAIAVGTGASDGCIPAGGSIAIRLNSPARVARR
jgi:hypothetical protein